MKFALSMALFSALLISTARAETVSPVADLQALRECLRSLHSVDQLYLSHVPSELVAMDRKLLRFKQGIRFLEENADLLEARAAVGQLDTFLIGNAVAGCEQYRAQVASRARFFAGFVLCAAMTGVALTLYFFLIIFPMSRKVVVHAPRTSDRGPQDVPVSSSTKSNL